MPFRIGTPLRLIGALLMLGALAGCSAGTRIAYNHLDRLALWEVSDYVDLDAAQTMAFETQFRDLWVWHRQRELPKYARVLRTAATAFDAGAPPPEVVRANLQSIEQRGDELGEQLRARLAVLLPLLDDAQVAALLARQRRAIEKDARKEAAESTAQRRERFLDNVNEAFERWLGPLNATQKELVADAWTAGLPTRAAPEQRREQRLEDLQAFDDLLVQRKAADFDARLAAFWHRDDDPARAASPRGRTEAAAQQRRNQLIVDLLGAVDATQRQHVQKKLRALAADFEALASEAPSGA